MARDDDSRSGRVSATDSLQADSPTKRLGAGAAYLRAIENNPKMQAGLERARVRLTAFAIVARLVSEPVNEALASVAAAVAEPMEIRREFVAALSKAMKGEFQELRALVDKYPEVKQAADGLELASAMRSTHSKQPMTASSMLA